MPPEMSEKLLMKRYSGDAGKKDIHEQDLNYQRKCRDAARYSAEYNGWKVVDCTRNGELRGIEDISQEILDIVLKVIKGEH